MRRTSGPFSLISSMISSRRRPHQSSVSSAKFLRIWTNHPERAERVLTRHGIRHVPALRFIDEFPLVREPQPYGGTDSGFQRVAEAAAREIPHATGATFRCAIGLKIVRRSAPMELSIIQARWQVGALRPEEIPDLATELLTAGVESPAVVQLAGLVQADREEVAPLLAQAFAECGLQPMTDDDARWRLAFATARAIVDGAVTPLAGATTLWGLATDLGLPEPLRYFVYLAADYGEGPGDRATEAAWFDATIVETARGLLEWERDSDASPH